MIALILLNKTFLCDMIELSLYLFTASTFDDIPNSNVCIHKGPPPFENLTPTLGLGKMFNNGQSDNVILSYALQLDLG